MYRQGERGVQARLLLKARGGEGLTIKVVIVRLMYETGTSRLVAMESSAGR